MRAKSIVLLILALGCGLVASVGINQVLANRGGSTAKPGETQPICVAIADIEMFDPVAAMVVKVEQWPKDKVPIGSLATLDLVQDRRAKTKIYAGEPLLDGKLLPKGESGAGASQLVPKGFRTVGVKVDMDSGLAGLIKPGDRVDVLVFVTANPQKGINETATHTVLQNVKVFAVDSTFRNEEEDAEQAIQARTVSLVVSPEQAEIVLLAAQLGKVQLSLRNGNDDEMASSTGTNTKSMFGSSSEPGDEKGINSSLPALLSGAQPKPVVAVKEPVTQLAQVEPTWRMTLYKGPASELLEFHEGQLPKVVSSTGGSSGGSSDGSGGIMTLPGFNPPTQDTNSPVNDNDDTSADDNADDSKN